MVLRSKQNLGSYDVDPRISPLPLAPKHFPWFDTEFLKVRKAAYMHYVPLLQAGCSSTANRVNVHLNTFLYNRLNAFLINAQASMDFQRLLAGGEGAGGDLEVHIHRFSWLLQHQDLRMVLVCNNGEDRALLGRHFNPLHLSIKHFPWFTMNFLKVKKAAYVH